MTLISVIMPVYNCHKFIREAIASILNQTEKDFELILFDDGSSKPLFDLIESYKDSRIIYIRNIQNKGLSHRLNDCLSISKGKYIARMDGDDISDKRRFEKQLALFEDGVGFVGCWGRSIDLNGNSIVHYIDTDCRCSDEDLMNVYPFKHCLADASVIYTREAFEKIGYYDTGVFQGESYNYYRRIQKYFKGRVLQEVLYIRRVGSGTSARKGNVDIISLCNEKADLNSIIKER